MRVANITCAVHACMRPACVRLVVVRVQVAVKVLEVPVVAATAVQQEVLQLVSGQEGQRPMCASGRCTRQRGP